VAYTVPGIWYLLRRRGWSCQMGARRAIERDDGAVRLQDPAAERPVGAPSSPTRMASLAACAGWRSALTASCWPAPTTKAPMWLWEVSLFANPYVGALY
jgi:hypothetical protein